MGTETYPKGGKHTTIYKSAHTGGTAKMDTDSKFNPQKGSTKSHGPTYGVKGV